MPLPLRMIKTSHRRSVRPFVDGCGEFCHTHNRKRRIISTLPSWLLAFYVLRTSTQSAYLRYHFDGSGTNQLDFFCRCWGGARRISAILLNAYCASFCFQGYEGSLLKVTSKNGKTSSVSKKKYFFYFITYILCVALHTYHYTEVFGEGGGGGGLIAVVPPQCPQKRCFCHHLFKNLCSCADNKEKQRTLFIKEKKRM